MLGHMLCMVVLCMVHLHKEACQCIVTRFTKPQQTQVCSRQLIINYMELCTTDV